ncbi:MAG: linear amide C-N hydrolase [Pseudomonadota bacterium]
MNSLIRLCLLICGFLTIHNALACTDIRVQAKDGTIIIARSMEFAEDLQSNLRTSTRGRTFTTHTNEGKPGMSWKAKYGYVYLDGMQVDAAIDGMNEEGLTIEDLFFPSFAQYETIPPGLESHAVPYMNFSDWVLSNFKTVAEVRAALPSVFVFAGKVPTMGDTIFPLHFSIYDASGSGIVVEFINGKLSVYDNVGVMTNSPSYDWHLLNLTNYVHLTPVNPAPIAVGGLNFGATGQGYGMIGMPGDVSPPSRFIKMAALLHVVVPATDSNEALNLAEHIINNVDIPFGLVREPQSDKYVSESTEWVVFKDVTHRMFYYRTYTNMSLQGVSLAKLNFSENATRLRMPIVNKQQVTDLTDQFLKATSK